MGSINNAIEIDLHKLRLYDAKFEICLYIEDAWNNGDQSILFIHGFNNGTSIRDFIRDFGGLRKKMARDYPEIPELEIIPCDKGTTKVIIMGKKKIVKREEEHVTQNVPSPKDESEIIYDNLIIVRGEIPELGMMLQDSGSTFMVITKT